MPTRATQREWQSTLLCKSGKSVVCHGGCVTALLAEFIDPFEHVSPKSFLVRTLSNNGENMDSCDVPPATDNRWNIDSSLEMKHTINCLRSLVCELLRTNQELRVALLEAKSGVPDHQGSQSLNISETKGEL